MEDIETVRLVKDLTEAIELLIGLASLTKDASPPSPDAIAHIKNVVYESYHEGQRYLEQNKPA